MTKKVRAIFGKGGNVFLSGLLKGVLEVSGM
jgi:hypothetical protein